MTRSVVSAIAVAALVLSAAAFALAQSQDDWRDAAESTGAPSLSLEQSYHGVRPGGGNTLPRVEEIRTKAGTWVTWPGFLMRPDGGSRIFLQTTRPIEYSRSNHKKKLTLTLKDASVHLTNNHNPLVTIHFNTPVRRAYLKRSRKQTDLVIELKVESNAGISQFSDQDGYHYLFVDFPPGSYPLGGDWGGRPSFSGFGKPGGEQPATTDAPPPDTAPAHEQQP